MPSILEVQNLSKKYGDFTAVRGISFNIEEGEIFSLLGPNGAGKTTTISMLSTLYEPTGGNAVIAGHSIKKEPMAVRGVIGVVPQDLALYEDLTARENLVFWGQMYNLGGKALNSRIDEVLEQIGLTDKAKNRVKTYSGGMKRRVNIGEPPRHFGYGHRLEQTGHDRALHHALYGRSCRTLEPGWHHRSW
jgi:ABC-2 type transport system ATP-binding protein